MTLGLWTIIFSVIASCVAAFASLHFIHMLQLESYQGAMYRKCISRAGQKDVYAFFLVGMAALFLRMAGVILYYRVGVAMRALIFYGADVLYVLLLLALGISYRRRKEKKKLAFTGRVNRLVVVLTLICFAFHMGLFIDSKLSSWQEITFMSGIRYLPGALLPYLVLLAYWINLPLENAVKRYYYNDAKRELHGHENLIKIGITGSYGKTSTKFILASILEKQYFTLYTPGSFNTPMGIAKIARGELNDAHEVFIAEMGARYKGDIAELCDLVGPKYGIITSVGKQHLETFGSFEDVIETKAELIKSIPHEGAVFINGDIDECRRLYDECALENKFMFGIKGEGLYMKAENIRVTNEGILFELIFDGHERIECKTALLGGHNILNITAAAALAKYLGMTMEQIAEGIAAVTPIEHRLQLIPGPVTVIDDAFNSNPAGARAAAETLASFAPARRVAVTPGMVELGLEQEALNEQFGRELAVSCDVAILVGKQNLEALKRGLLDAGFDGENIVEAATLDDVTAILPDYAPPGSVVLFENDLPDNYV